jgi:hypothetical protein
MRSLILLVIFISLSLTRGQDYDGRDNADYSETENSGEIKERDNDGRL